MVRAPFVDENGLKKGAWSVEEDNRLKAYIQKYGHWNWRELPKFAGLARCGKSCRLRWMNYLRPNVKHGSYTKEEEDLIIKLHQQLGNRWSKIAKNLPGRTDNEIKNYWHTNLRRRFQQPIRINKKKQMPSLTRKSQSNTSQTHNNYDYDVISQLNTNANAKTNLHILESCPMSPQRTNSITVACSLNSKTLSTSSDDMHINFDLQPHNSTNEYLSPISGLVEALTSGSVVKQTFGDGGSNNENINCAWDSFGEEILDHSLWTELCDLEAYQLYNDEANFNFENEELLSFPTLSSYWEMIDFSDLPHLAGRPGSYLTYENIMS